MTECNSKKQGFTKKEKIVSSNKNGYYLSGVFDVNNSFLFNIESQRGNVEKGIKSTAAAVCCGGK